MATPIYTQRDAPDRPARLPSDPGRPLNGSRSNDSVEGRIMAIDAPDERELDLWWLPLHPDFLVHRERSAVRPC